MLNSRKGFTLVEMVVVMAVFLVVVMITADAFKTILTQVTKLTKSEESNIEGMLGLEMFRHDIQQAGFGLPYSFLSPIKYAEAGVTPANKFNDGTSTTASAVPRAVVAGDDLAAVTDSGSYNILDDTDYLVLKASSLGLSAASQKWTYMPFDDSVASSPPHIWPSENMTSGTDRVIVMRKAFSEATYTNQLIVKDSETFSAIYDSDGFDEDDKAFRPTLKEEVYYLYGITPGSAARMPFNRADFFVATPSASSQKPAFCAENTGIFYKGVVNHGDGKLNYIPLLDCVADMQVVFGWDVDDGQGNEGQDGAVDTYSTPLALNNVDITVSPSANKTRVTTALADAEKLRASLKLVKVYLLAQVGRRNPGFQSAETIRVGNVSTDGLSKVHTLTTNMRQYHWKVYRVVVSPKNLQANQ